MKPGAEHERLSAYLDDALPVAERDEFERLLAGRPDLQTLATEWRQLRTAFRALPARTLPPSFKERVLATAEQRMLRGPATSVVRAAPRRHWYALAGVAVAAAAVLLVILSFPTRELRLARQQGPLDEPPAASTTGAETDRPEGRTLPPPQELIADDLSAAAPPRLGEEAEEREIPLSQIAATAMPTYDFTVLVFPENTTQIDQLQRILPRPAVEATSARLERLSALDPDVAGMERQRLGIPARGRDDADRSSVPVADPAAASAAESPVDLYVAAGAAAEIQSLLLDLRAAGIPVVQQDHVDPSWLAATEVPLAATARSDLSHNVEEGMTDGAGFAATEELAEADRLPVAAETRRGIRFQYLGQVVRAPSQQSKEAQNDADRETWTGSDAAAASESQQILIVVQNPVPEPNDR